MTSESSTGRLTEADVAGAGLGDWRFADDKIHARFELPFLDGAQLVVALAEIAERLNHHPDIDLRYGYVAVAAHSHDAGGVTARDVTLAREISAAAAAAGAVPRPDLAAG